MESRYLYDEVEIFALCVEYFTEEMLYFKDTYGWSDEFISRLEKRREEFKSAYEDAKKKIEEKLSSKWGYECDVYLDGKKITKFIQNFSKKTCF